MVKRPVFLSKEKEYKMARRRLLLPHLAAVTADIVIEYCRELKGNLVATFQHFDLITAQEKNCVGFFGNKLAYFNERSFSHFEALYGIYSVLALKNGDVACGLAHRVNLYRGTHLVAQLNCGKYSGFIRYMTEFSDGSLVTATEVGVLIWNLSSSPPSKTVVRVKCAAALLALDARRLVVGDYAGRIHVYTSEDLSMFAHGHTERVTGLAVLGNKLVSSSLDKKVCIWDIANKSLVHTINFSSGVRTICGLNDGRLVVGCNNHEITVWDVHGCTLALYVQAAEDVDLRVRGGKLAFATFGQKLVVSDTKDTRFFT